MNKVVLVNLGGATSIHIEVEVTDEGALLFSGQDIGAAPSELYGDSDYEYWLTIPAKDKDKLLLALLEKYLSGNHKVISELRQLCEAKGISCGFFCH